MTGSNGTAAAPMRTIGTVPSAPSWGFSPDERWKEFMPYLKPQECGNKTGVRWIKVHNEAGQGLLFTAENEVEASVLPYTPTELEESDHAYKLPRATRRWCASCPQADGRRRGRKLVGQDASGIYALCELYLLVPIHE